MYQATGQQSERGEERRVGKVKIEVAEGWLSRISHQPEIRTPQSSDTSQTLDMSRKIDIQRSYDHVCNMHNTILAIHLTCCAVRTESDLMDESK